MMARRTSSLKNRSDLSAEGAWYARREAFVAAKGRQTQEADDGERGNTGVAVSIVERPDGKARLVLDDIRRGGAAAPFRWTIKDGSARWCVDIGPADYAVVVLHDLNDYGPWTTTFWGSRQSRSASRADSASGSPRGSRPSPSSDSPTCPE
jgi:hypothetical protein